MMFSALRYVYCDKHTSQGRLSIKSVGTHAYFNVSGPNV